MPTHQTESDFQTEPKRRFYPPLGMQSLPIPPKTISDIRLFPYKKEDDAAYFAHRHPISLQRLYEAADAMLNTYPRHGFIYDAYPDDISLRLVRDRLLRENPSLTEAFLQAGCPITWLNLLTDTVLSELLLRLRQTYRNPNGDANTTSVQSLFRS